MNTETVEAINKLTDAINHLASLITQNLGENNKAAHAPTSHAPTSQEPAPTPQTEISQSDLQTACLEAVRANAANKDKIKALMVEFSVRNILELNDHGRTEFYKQMQKVITK
jgi:hypothetical protein